MGKTSDVKVPPQANDSFYPCAVTIKRLDQRQKSAARRARTCGVLGWHLGYQGDSDTQGDQTQRDYKPT